MLPMPGRIGWPACAAHRSSVVHVARLPEYERSSPPGLLACLAWLDPKELLGLPFAALVLALLAMRAPAIPPGSSAIWALAGFAIVLVVWGVGIALTLIRPARRWLRASRRRAEAAELIRDLAAFGLCFSVYASLQWAVPLLNPRLFDPQLAALDRLLFGAPPALWFDPVVSPSLTLLFSLCYFLHFPLFFVTPLVLFLQGRHRERADVALGLMLAMYLGFVGYFFIPALGPFAGLADAFTHPLDDNPLRSIVSDYGVGLGTFPSLHAGIAAVVLAFAWRDNRRLFWLLLPVALSIWLSTLYLRYHYVVDLLAGWALALACRWLAPRINAVRTAWLHSRAARQTRVRLARRAWSVLPGRSGV